MKTSFRVLLLLIIFSVAMGFLETAVVVYLRKIYYPEGFHLPLKIIDAHTSFIEVLREFSTLIMLIIIAIVSGKNPIQRFAFFLICFGIWDIFYYLFLKLLLNWPGSILEGDVLFLIPVPWIGPVLAPCILSLTMILIAIFFLRNEHSLTANGVGSKNILFMIAGSCIIIYSFVMNYKYYVQIDSTHSLISETIAPEYDWQIFALGEMLIIAPFLLMAVKRRSQF